jgi:L-fuconolactonase
MVYLPVDVASAYGLLVAKWAVDQAGRDSRLKGVVPYAPMEDGAVSRSYLTALAQLGPLVKGVRRLMQGETDPDFPVRPGLLEGVRLLPEYGYSFDICIYHHQLARTVDLVRACPETSFILDHLGKPAARAGLLEPWREHISQLAALPNVVCKVSGLVTEADHASWTPEQLEPYILHVLTAFGEDRVLFGGDWPVVTLASSYRRWAETLSDLTRDLGAAAQRKLWSDNALRVYRL